MSTYGQGLLSRINKLKPELHARYGVVKIGVFDCYLKEHQGTLCDLNVLVELERPLGWKYFELKSFIERKLQLHIDIFSPKAIKPALRDEIMRKTKFA